MDYIVVSMKLKLRKTQLDVLDLLLDFCKDQTKRILLMYLLTSFEDTLLSPVVYLC